MNSSVTSCLVKTDILEDSVRVEAGKSENKINNIRLKKEKANIEFRRFLGKKSSFSFEDRPIVSLIQGFV